MAESGGGWVKVVVAGNPGPLTLDGTRTYVLGPEPCLVIDPGPDLADHLDAVEVTLGTVQVAAVCVTHYHADHAAGTADLILRLAAPLAATPQSAERAALDPPDLPLAAGSTLDFGGGHLEVILTPGHCADHVCFHWPQARALFTGDVILGEGTSMIAPPEGDMAAYMSTLERLAELDLSIIYPGHGPEIDEPAEKLIEYLEHRRERERQVLDALAAGATTPSEIRARVYEDLDPRLFGAAEGSVAAHLGKLVAEGHVRATEDGYRMVGPA
ncbi:MAG: MBL fold metallo-hydrolase [Gemmatimonadota bacterium]|nr:MAG: MBL fold metallo-hydrolase [Gemmatimonadota bacterium]